MLPGKSGTSQLKDLLAAEEQIQKANPGQTIPELDEWRQLDYDISLYPVYSTFLELNKRRRWSEAGPLPISFEEIQAWGFCFASTLSVVEIKIILRLDDVWLAAYRKVSG